MHKIVLQARVLLGRRLFVRTSTIRWKSYVVLCKYKDNNINTFQNNIGRKKVNLDILNVLAQVIFTYASQHSSVLNLHYLKSLTTYTPTFNMLALLMLFPRRLLMILPLLPLVMGMLTKGLTLLRV